MKKKLKYIGKDTIGVTGLSIVGLVKENDIIEVNESDFDRLILKKEHGKPLFEAVKDQPKKSAKKETETEVNE